MISSTLSIKEENLATILLKGTNGSTAEGNQIDTNFFL